MAYQLSVEWGNFHIPSTAEMYVFVGAQIELEHLRLNWLGGKVVRQSGTFHVHLKRQFTARLNEEGRQALGWIPRLTPSNCFRHSQLWLK